MKEMNILPPSGRVFIGVSGGLDSMVLLFVLGKLVERGCLKEVVAVHINHGTRPENNQEAEQVRIFAEKLKIICHIESINLDLEMCNFEAVARLERYKVFKRYLLENGDLFCTGHHIDDSFEWSMLQQFKSGNLKSTLGIPVVNGKFIRPFMCATKKHISVFAKILEIPYSEDISNGNNRFERNFIRNKLFPVINERFPHTLKHYVYRSNELARKMNLFAGTSVQNNNSQFILKDDGFGGVSILHSEFENDFSGAEQLITSVISRLSTKNRGILGTQIKKTIEAAKNGKTGPLSYSGGVKGYLFHGFFYFIHEKNISKIFDMDRIFLEKMLHLKQSEIPFLDFHQFKKKYFAWKMEQFNSALIVSFDPELKELFPSIKTVHPLWPEITKYAINNGIWIQSVPRFLYFLNKKKYTDRKFRSVVLVSPCEK